VKLSGSKAKITEVFKNSNNSLDKCKSSYNNISNNAKKEGGEDCRSFQVFPLARLHEAATYTYERMRMSAFTEKSGKEQDNSLLSRGIDLQSRARSFVFGPVLCSHIQFICAQLHDP